MFKKRIALILGAILIAVCPVFSAQDKKEAAGKDAVEKKDSTAKKNVYQDIQKKKTAEAKGMFTITLSGGKVYFEIPDSLLEREFVMGTTIKSISDNNNGVVGSKAMNLQHITFARRDSTLLLRELESEYISPDGNIERALSKSNVGPIMKSFPVKAWGPDSSAVYDVTEMFLEHDKKYNSPFMEISKYADYERTEKFIKDLSYISGIRSFSDNLSVTSSMSYTYTLKKKGESKPLISDQPLTAELTRSILLLPEKIYHPRRGDYRIGYFHTTREQLGSTVESSKEVYFTNRWNLTPSDTAAYKRGELVEPVKPIVFYIDSDFPEWWKPYIREAVDQWNEPFEKAGFKNAIEARDFPKDDPEFDPDNIKYSCIRYAPIGIQNAMGPSWVDPRSGEIITASVYVYHDIIKLLGRWMFVQTAQTDERIRRSYIPGEILGDGLRYVISHEVGHCLGLMHNMSASYAIPVEKLRDPEFTSVNGTTTSIMDYARFNYVAQPGDAQRGVKLTPPRFGAYDYWAIRWGYTPVFDVDDFDKEAEITSGWITDSLKVGGFYKYGKQQMSSIFYDPRCQAEDLGDDVVTATRYGVKNLKYISGNFMEWCSDDDEDYSQRISLYNGILNQYLTYCQHVLLNVGGIYKNEVKSCDIEAPFLNIPREKQLEALNYMFELEKDLDWMEPLAVKNRLPIIANPIKAVRKSVEGLILMAPFLASRSDGVVTKELSSAECFGIIFDNVFGPTKKGRKLTESERAFQKEYVLNLMASAGYKVKGAGSKEIGADSWNTCPEQFGFEPSFSSGDLMYSPVCGYEWLPRAIFNRGDITVGTIYVQLLKVHKLLKRKVSSGSEEDRAHYRILIDTIEKGLEL